MSTLTNPTANRSILAIATFGLVFASARLASAYPGTVYGEVSCAGYTECDYCNPSVTTCNYVGQITPPYNMSCASGSGPANPIATDATPPPSWTGVVTKPNIFMLHWGSYWATSAAEAAEDVQVWQKLGTDWRFWHPLGEYAPSTASYVEGSVIPFGSQTILGALPQMNGAGPSTPVTITDVEIQNELTAEMWSLNQGVPLSNESQIYVVVLPPYVEVEYSTFWGSSVSFDSYHSYFNDGSAYVWYAVIPSATPVATYANPQYPTAQLRSRDFVTSHEVYEATTDPLVDESGPTPYTSGFTVQQSCGNVGTNEIADMCEYFFSDPIDGYTVATFWSNEATGCVGPSSLDTTPAPRPTLAEGCGYRCNENTDTLQTICATLPCVHGCGSPVQCCIKAGGEWDGKFCE